MDCKNSVFVQQTCVFLHGYDQLCAFMIYTNACFCASSTDFLTFRCFLVLLLLYIYISLFWAQEGFPVSATPCMVWFLYVHVTSSFMSFMQDFYFSLYYSNDHDHAHSFSLVFEKLQWSVACEPTFILWIIIQLLSDPFFYVKNKNKVLLLSFER